MSPAGGKPASTADDDQRTSVQAIVLIIVAVVIGVLLLALGFDKEGGLTDASGGATTTTTVSTGADAPPPIETTTTTATPATNPPASVSIVVANASGGSGQASKAQTSLEAKGYTQVATSNASVTPTSTVYYAAGAEGDAQAIATALSIPPANVKPMPASPPAPLNGATVLVVLGADKL